MKHKTNIIIFALLILSISASAQIQFTAGLNYESGVPSGAPSSTGSRIRVNLATGRVYIWNQAGSNWRVLAQGIDIVAGCSAPLYTPGYGQSLFAINGCASPDLYYYTGTAWVQINAGGGGGGATYYAGEGIDITNDTISVDTVQRLSFRTDQTYSDGLGTLSWDDANGTLQLGLKGGNVSLQLGQESVQLVKHADNTGLTKGKVVYLTGSAGGNLTVRYARANNESTSANTFGVMTEDATGGNKGFCTTFGLVHNINTSNLTEGGMVWLSKDTAGAMTAVRPTAPNNGVELGFCVTKHATNGVIFVTVQNGYELDELHNVHVPSPTNGHVLTYNTTNTRWEAATVADQSATNEGIIGVSAGSATTSVITSNTSTANGVTVSAGTGISLSETTSTNGGTITVANSAPDQTVSITNGGGITQSGTYPNFTLTATDQSTTNELQTIDTFSLSGQTLRASLSMDNQPAKIVTLPVTNVTAGTGISVSSATGNYTVTNSAPDQTVSITNGGGVGVTGNYPSFTLTATDQSITNEIQRLDTFSLSGQTLSASLLNDGVAASSVTLPIVDVVAGTNVTVTKSNGVATVSATGGGGGGGTVTGAGVAGRAAFWRSTSAISSDANFAWDSTNVRLNIGAPSTPTARLNVRGGGTSSSSATQIWTNSGNTELMRINDAGRVGIGIAPDATAFLNVNGSVYCGEFALRSNPTTSYGFSGNQCVLVANGTQGIRIFQGGTIIGTGSSIPTFNNCVIRGRNTSVDEFALNVQNSTPTDLYKVENNGRITYWATNTDAGTTGARTINRPSGTVNFGIGASSLVVTNSLCTTNSIVFATVRTNDSTAYIKNVVPGSGSFTINLGAAATAETSVGFFIIN